MDRRPIEARIRSTTPADEAAERGVASQRFRDALARWATGVTLVAVREGERVYATTATSFASISADPPLVLVSLGPTAQVLPFLDDGRSFVVNVLSAPQRRLATVFADAYPVGPSPFPPGGDPVLEGTEATLVCRVERRLPVEGGATLVLGLVEKAVEGEGAGRPLLYYQRDYGELG